MTVLAIVCLAVAIAGLVSHFAATSWQPVIAATSGARMAMWPALPAVALAFTARQWLLGAVPVAAVMVGSLLQVARR